MNNIGTIAAKTKAKHTTTAELIQTLKNHTHNFCSTPPGISSYGTRCQPLLRMQARKRASNHAGKQARRHASMEARKHSSRMTSDGTQSLAESANRHIERVSVPSVKPCQKPAKQTRPQYRRRADLTCAAPERERCGCILRQGSDWRASFST